MFERAYEEAQARAEPVLSAKPQKHEPPRNLRADTVDDKYTGDHTDRHAVLAHRKAVEQERTRRALELERWNKERKAAEKKAKDEARMVVAQAKSEVFKAQALLKKAQIVLLKAESMRTAGEESAALKRVARGDELTRRQMERIRAIEERKKEKMEARERKRLEREEQKRKREQEELDAKRYPIDDLLLQEELAAKADAEGAPRPAPLPSAPPLSEIEKAVVPSAMAVVEFIASFGKAVGINPVPLKDLLAMTLAPGPELAALFQQILAIVLEKGANHPSGMRRIRRWRVALCDSWAAAAWPEVLKRYILCKGATRCSEEVWYAAESLDAVPFDQIPPGQLAALLEHITEDILDTEAVRGEMEGRLEALHEITVERRQARIDHRKRMKVFEDAAKAERRKEREAKKEAKKKAKERAAARGNLEDGEEAENSEEEEPTFEIPADKLVFQGNAADRQAVLAHRKWVEVETARLSRARYVWEKERRKKQMEETAARNAGRLAREREEVGHEKKMDSFDRELARIAIRAQHLGLDRNLSRYWWGLASQRADVFVETEEGRWGKFASLDDLTEFVQALDSRSGPRIPPARPFRARRGCPELARTPSGRRGRRISPTAPPQSPQRRPRAETPGPTSIGSGCGPARGAELGWLCGLARGRSCPSSSRGPPPPAPAPGGPRSAPPSPPSASSAAPSPTRTVRGSGGPSPPQPTCGERGQPDGLPHCPGRPACRRGSRRWAAPPRPPRPLPPPRPPPHRSSPPPHRPLSCPSPPPSPWPSSWPPSWLPAPSCARPWRRPRTPSCASDGRSELGGAQR